MEAAQFDQLKTAAGQDLAGLSLKELAMLFLHKETPAGLCKAIASDLRFMGLIGSVVELPYNELDYRVPDDIPAETEQKMQQAYEQVCELLKWFEQLPPDSAPPVIELLPRDLQAEAAARLRDTLFRKLSGARLLTLLYTDLLPAWARQAVREHFQDITKSAEASNPDRPRRHRTRRPDMQPPKTNESENL